jgi:hypothetical protein
MQVVVKPKIRKGIQGQDNLKATGLLRGVTNYTRLSRTRDETRRPHRFPSTTTLHGLELLPKGLQSRA